jgi:hypothetical protein
MKHLNLTGLQDRVYCGKEEKSLRMLILWTTRNMTGASGIKTGTTESGLCCGPFSVMLTSFGVSNIPGLDGEGDWPLVSLKDTTKRTSIDDANGLDDQGGDKPLNEKTFQVYPEPAKDTAAVNTSTPTPAFKKPVFCHALDARGISGWKKPIFLHLRKRLV